MSQEDCEIYDIPAALGEHAFVNFNHKNLNTSVSPNETTYEMYKDLPVWKKYKNGDKYAKNSIFQRIAVERQKYGQVLWGKLMEADPNITSIPESDQIKMFRSKDRLSDELMFTMCKQRYNKFKECGTADRRVGARGDELKEKNKKSTKRGPVLDSLVSERCKLHFQEGGKDISDVMLNGFVDEAVSQHPELELTVVHFDSSSSFRFFNDQLKISRKNGEPITRSVKREAHIKSELVVGFVEGNKKVKASHDNSSSQSNCKANKKVRNVFRWNFVLFFG
jgi:hypothetical protein